MTKQAEEMDVLYQNMGQKREGMETLWGSAGLPSSGGGVTGFDTDSRLISHPSQGMYASRFYRIILNHKIFPIFAQFAKILHQVSLTFVSRKVINLQIIGIKLFNFIRFINTVKQFLNFTEYLTPLCQLVANLSYFMS